MTQCVESNRSAAFHDKFKRDGFTLGELQRFLRNNLLFNSGVYITFRSVRCDTVLIVSGVNVYKCGTQELSYWICDGGRYVILQVT